MVFPICVKAYYRYYVCEVSVEELVILVNLGGHGQQSA